MVVETRDQWTINIDVSYNSTGNRQESGGSISDDNLLGTGKSVSFGMTSDPERTSTTIGYKDLAFLGRRWQIDLEDTESSDGFARFLRVRYPFFALPTPRAGGVEWRETVLGRAPLVGRASEAVTGPADTRDFEAWFGLRLPGTGIRTDRLIVGVFGEQALFGDWRPRPTAPRTRARPTAT